MYDIKIPEFLSRLFCCILLLLLFRVSDILRLCFRAFGWMRRGYAVFGEIFYTFLAWAGTNRFKNPTSRTWGKKPGWGGPSRNNFWALGIRFRGKFPENLFNDSDSGKFPGGCFEKITPGGGALWKNPFLYMVRRKNFSSGGEKFFLPRAAKFFSSAGKFFSAAPPILFFCGERIFLGRKNLSSWKLFSCWEKTAVFLNLTHQKVAPFSACPPFFL